MQLKSRGRAGSLAQVIASVLVLFGLSMLGFVGCSGNLPAVERFTEFYLLGPDGKATDYPKEVKVGQEQKVILGIVNREQQKVTYRVKIMVSELPGAEIGPILLEDSGKWEQPVTFTPTRVGDKQKLEFLLFKNNASQPSETLFLFLNVRE